MNNERLKKKILQSKYFLLAATLALCAGVFIGATLFSKIVVVRQGTANTPAAMSSVNLMLDFGNGIIKTWNTVSWHESFSVLNLLEMIADAKGVVLFIKDGGDKGMLVESIDGTRNDGKTNMRWQYWVNNTYEPRPASKYYLKPGDLVVWKYVKEQTQ